VDSAGLVPSPWKTGFSTDPTAPQLRRLGAINGNSETDRPPDSDAGKDARARSGNHLWICARWRPRNRKPPTDSAEEAEKFCTRSGAACRRDMSTRRRNDAGRAAGPRCGHNSGGPSTRKRVFDDRLVVLTLTAPRQAGRPSCPSGRGAQAPAGRIRKPGRMRQGRRLRPAAFSPTDWPGPEDSSASPRRSTAATRWGRARPPDGAAGARRGTRRTRCR
jgi:hypothetical protein